MVREIITSDLHELLKLYTQLHDNPIAEITPEVLELWNEIIADMSNSAFPKEIGETIPEVMAGRSLQR